MAIIEVEGLSYKYPAAESFSLTNLNLIVERGEFVLVTGPSGCGKSTFCRTLNGLVPHFYGGEMTGKVVVDGLDTKAHSVAGLSESVGMVFQDPESQLFSLTVESEVAFGPENLGLSRKEIGARVKDSLEEVGATHLSDRAPFELSGGEQQRVAVAAALAMKPRVLVLDEPTSNLDPKGAASLFDVVYSLKRQGVTVIMVEHRLDLAASMADRVVVLDQGKKVADGKTEVVLASELLEGLGIGVPKVIELYKALIAEGLVQRPLDYPTSADKMANILKGVLLD